MSRTLRELSKVGLCALVAVACSAEQLGIPRTAVRSPSPDGRHVAAVRRHAALDPPNQSLWLKREGQPWARLAQLGADTHWCDAIAWADDSKRVAFLIQDASAMVFDSASSRLLASIALVEFSDVPTGRAVRQFSFEPDGGSLRVTVCDRRSGARCETTVVPLSSRSARLSE